MKVRVTPCPACSATIVWTSSDLTGAKVALDAESADGAVVVFQLPRPGDTIHSAVVLPYGSPSWFTPERFKVHACFPKRTR